MWHYPIVAGTGFTIALSHEQVAAWQVCRLEDAFEALVVAALFSIARDDGDEHLYFTPRASALATRLLKANGGQPSDPPVNDGTVSRLVGHSVDVRFLSS